jgi:hypothetical protein
MNYENSISSNIKTPSKKTTTPRLKAGGKEEDMSTRSKSKND